VNSTIPFSLFLIIWVLVFLLVLNLSFSPDELKVVILGLFAVFGAGFLLMLKYL